MFHKPNSSCSTAKATTVSQDQQHSSQKRQANKTGGNNKKNKNAPAASGPSHSSSAAVDTPIRKSDIRSLKQTAKDFFLSWRTDDSNYEQHEKLLTFILDQVFAANLIASRNLHHPELGRLTAYVRIPTPPKRDNDNDDDDAFTWPYATSQIIWIRQPPMPNTSQVEVVIPTVALLSVLPPESMPTVYVPSAASINLCRGAHLMRAGMLSLPASLETNATNDLRHVSKPRAIAISAVGNPQPMAVGLIHDGVHSATDIGPGTKGVGAFVWTCYGDDLWQQHVKELQALPTVQEVISPMGGASYNDGHYGNVGFVDGERVHPIVESQTAASEDDADEGARDGSVTGTSDADGDARNAPTAAQQLDAAEATTLATDTMGDQTDEATSPPAQEEEESISQDDLLHQSVCMALLTSLSPKDLPITVANFYANHVLPCRPPGTIIQLKQTKYKKFGNYLQEQVEQKLLTLGPGPNKDNKDKTGYLMAFDKRHADLLDFKQEHAKEVQEAKDITQAAEAAKQQKMVLVNLYVVPHHFVALLRLDPDAVNATNASSTERAGTGMLTMTELRQLLGSYLTREDLIDDDEVQLDGPLFDALYKKKKQTGDGAVTNDLLTVSRKDLAEQWVVAMNPAYAVVQMPGNKVQTLGKGHPPKVQIEVSLRGSKKCITKIRGMEGYGVNGTVLGKDIGRRLACQATVETHSDKGAALAKGCVEIVLGGNFANEVEALLLGDEKLCPDHGGIKNSDYRLPKGCVDVVVRKGVPVRKKGGGGGGKKD